MRVPVRAALLAMLPLAVACSEIPTDPVSSEEAQLNQSGPPRDRVTGSWKLAQIPGFPTLEVATYRTHAYLKDGRVTGTFELDEVYPTHVDHVEGVVTCFTILPNGMARVGGIITAANVPSSPGNYVGLAAVWLVDDNGSVGDLATDVIYGYSAGVDLGWCANGGSLPRPLMPALRSSITVVGGNLP